jgi:hypothetical protein
VYFVAPRQGSGSPSEYQDDVEWATGPAVPRTYFQGGTDMKWTSSAESSQSAMSRYSDVASSAIPSPNTDYATMSPYGTSPQPYEYDQNYTLSSQPVRNVSYSSYRKPENCVGQLAENVLPSRHTPSSLKWRLNSDLLKLYSFIVTRGKEPYFELLPRWTATQATPQIVHLDSTKYVTKKSPKTNISDSLIAIFGESTPATTQMLAGNPSIGQLTLTGTTRMYTVPDRRKIVTAVITPNAEDRKSHLLGRIITEII